MNNLDLPGLSYDDFMKNHANEGDLQHDWHASIPPFYMRKKRSVIGTGNTGRVDFQTWALSHALDHKVEGIPSFDSYQAMKNHLVDLLRQGYSARHQVPMLKNTLIEKRSRFIDSSSDNFHEGPAEDSDLVEFVRSNPGFMTNLNKLSNFQLAQVMQRLQRNLNQLRRNKRAKASTPNYAKYYSNHPGSYRDLDAMFRKRDAEASVDWNNYFGNPHIGDVVDRSTISKRHDQHDQLDIDWNAYFGHPNPAQEKVRNRVSFMRFDQPFEVKRAPVQFATRGHTFVNL